jgi:L-2,4-diaminobutyrate transaminase
MLAGIEFVAEPKTRSPFDPALKIGARVSKACRDRGLIARAMPHGDILGFAPPLVMSITEVDEIIGITKAAVEDVARDVRPGR